MNNLKILRKGSKIGIVSGSAPEAAKEKERFLKGINRLKSMGFNVVIAEHTCNSNGYLSGTELEMAGDINNMFADPTIDCIMCSGGGTNSNRILRHLDYELITNNPKIFVGVSNPTTILNAITAKTGLVTFHGPSIVWDYGDDNFPDFTKDSFMNILTRSSECYIFPNCENKWHTVKGGTASGELVGGNLISIQCLLGTPYEPNWTGKILIWEDICKPLERIDLMLTHFRDVGVFEKIAGMIIGELVACEGADTGLDELLNELMREYSFPIISKVPFGHTSNKLTLPLGTTVYMDADNLILKSTSRFLGE